MWRIIALVDNKAWRGRRLWRDIYIPRQCWSVSFSMPDLSPVMPNFKQKFRLSGKKRHSIRAIVCLPARKQTQRYSNSAIATATSSRQKEQQLSKARGEPNPLIMRPIQRSCVATPMSLQRRKQDQKKSSLPVDAETSNLLVRWRSPFKIFSFGFTIPVFSVILRRQSPSFHLAQPTPSPAAPRKSYFVGSIEVSDQGMSRLSQNTYTMTCKSAG